LTTQFSELVHQTTVAIELKSLKTDKGLNLLLNYVNPRPSEENVTLAKAISSDVDGMPLLLVGLAGYMTQSHRSLREILGILKSFRPNTKRMMSSDSINSAIFQYERPIRRVFDLALAAIQPPARAVLDVMSMLSPDIVPEDMVSTIIQDPVISPIPGAEKAMKLQNFQV
jgi:hypothetical protein